MVIRRILIICGIGVIIVSGILWAQAPSENITLLRQPAEDSSVITVGWVGDMVPSLDAQYNLSVFDSVTSYLQKPDLLIGNLEGTFAQEHRIDKCTYLLSLCHAFRGDASFAQALKINGFDFVSLVNNHSYDYGDDGLQDTQAVLDSVGIPYISPLQQTAQIIIKGKRIGILGLSSTEPTRTITDYAFITKTVSSLKEQNDFVIVIFHGGSEGSDKTKVPGNIEYMGNENRGDVQKVAHTAIDAGADLVLGSGPHVLRKVELYKTTYIAYSLGNFVGGRRLRTEGILGSSGIFTTSLQESKKNISYTITSVRLSKEGVPNFDETNEGAQRVFELSQ